MFGLRVSIGPDAVRIGLGVLALGTRMHGKLSNALCHRPFPSLGLHRANQLVRAVLHLQAPVRLPGWHERGHPRPDLVEKKSTLLAQALERSPQWQELTRNHLEERTAAFDGWTDDFVAHVAAKGRVPDTTEAERSARSTTQ